ncbi:hypothetical protein N7452_007844 [Penicillium brevicompactum]|uniref:Uncharacterized protein n=1 Tax=Penicillium brevicompactum TaxID=5074 RepID=A0A9W9UED5_PENBR|nr:hypothetical protein N7452_007844 [Penicillium brevicompactum]
MWYTKVALKDNTGISSYPSPPRRPIFRCGRGSCLAPPRGASGFPLKTLIHIPMIVTMEIATQMILCHM